jgi:hypothetical protein
MDPGALEDRPRRLLAGAGKQDEVAGPIGAGSRVEYRALGDALTMATLVQSLALPNSVLVGPRTRTMAGDSFIWSGEARYQLPNTAIQISAEALAAASTAAVAQSIRALLVALGQDWSTAVASTTENPEASREKIFDAICDGAKTLEMWAGPPKTRGRFRKRERTCGG